jgi:hypothetical protein
VEHVGGDCELIPVRQVATDEVERLRRIGEAERAEREQRLHKLQQEHETMNKQV